jgi:hypothetical protein
MLQAIIVIFLISLSSVIAQDKPAGQFHNQIGASGSFISGFGITYHYIFSDNYRIKHTAFYFYDGADSKKSSYDIYISMGIEGQKTLFKTETTRLYALLGIGFFQQANYDYGAEYGFSSYSRKENTYSGGTGVGIELLAVGRVAFNLDLGLLYSFSERKIYTNDGTTPPISPQYRSNVGVGFGGGLGFGYQF